jgi:hypothetical protein
MLNQQLMEELRRRVLEVTKQHEDESQGGAPCWPERCNVVAWIAHSLGVQSDEHLRFTVHAIHDYRESHQERHAGGHEHGASSST